MTKPSASEMEQGQIQSELSFTTTRRHGQTQNQLYLTNLPVEVLGTVLRHLNILSCFRFALTSISFWDIGWWHVQRAVIES